MTNEEIFTIIKEMFSCSNYNKIMKLGNILKSNNVIIKDLNNKLVIYNNNKRIIIPTIGKGTDRKYLFKKSKVDNI